jgi:hypothetical protein
MEGGLGKPERQRRGQQPAQGRARNERRPGTPVHKGFQPQRGARSSLTLFYFLRPFSKTNGWAAQFDGEVRGNATLADGTPNF